MGSDTEFLQGNWVVRTILGNPLQNHARRKSAYPGEGFSLVVQLSAVEFLRKAMVLPIHSHPPVFPRVCFQASSEAGVPLCGLGFEGSSAQRYGLQSL